MKTPMEIGSQAAIGKAEIFPISWDCSNCDVAPFRVVVQRQH